MNRVELPWPPALLSGHAKGHFWARANVTAQYRAIAYERAGIAGLVAPEGAGDIRIHIRFEPPNRRGDRVNFPNRLKPYFDGIADALGVNDSRFHPSYEFAEPVKGGRVVVTVSTGEARSIGEIIAPIVAGIVDNINSAEAA